MDLKWRLCLNENYFCLISKIFKVYAFETEILIFIEQESKQKGSCDRLLMLLKLNVGFRNMSRVSVHWPTGLRGCDFCFLFVASVFLYPIIIPALSKGYILVCLFIS